jgi:hypothetical protein
MMTGRVGIAVCLGYMTVGRTSLNTGAQFTRDSADQRNVDNERQMYRYRWSCQIIYGSYADFFEIQQKKQMLVRERGWKGSSLWVATSGNLNDFFEQRDYDRFDELAGELAVREADYDYKAAPPSLPLAAQAHRNRAPAWRGLWRVWGNPQGMHRISRTSGISVESASARRRRLGQQTPRTLAGSVKGLPSHWVAK